MAIYEVFPGSSPAPLFSDDTGNGPTALKLVNAAGANVWEVRPNGFELLTALAIEPTGIGADQSIDTGGTIAADGAFATLVHTSSAADKTGVIMHQPTTNVVKLILNYSANSITFAAAGTSFVAAGAAAVIPAGAGVLMVYVLSKSLWIVTNL